MASIGRDFAQLGRFLAPIAFTNIAKDIGQQVLNRSLSKGSSAVTTLAGFGLAYTLMKLFTNSLSEFKNVGLVLVLDRASRRRSLVILAISGLATALFMLLLGATKLGAWFVEDLHGVNEDTGRAAYMSFLSLCAYPLLDSVASLHAGCLLRVKRSGFVGMASMADMGLQIVMVTILLHTDLLCARPLAIPVLALYTGGVARLVMSVFGYHYFVHPALPGGDGTTSTTSTTSTSSSTTTTSTSNGDSGAVAVAAVESPGYRRILKFFWPLALVKVMQSVSRPIVNLMCARSSRHISAQAADTTVAVLSLTFPIGHLPYGWVNETRALAPTFRRRRKPAPGGGRAPPPMAARSIALFVLLCVAVSVAAMLLLFWVPGVASAVLRHANGVSPALAAASLTPLRVFTFFGVAVALRSHYTGWLMLRERTRAVAPSAPARVLVIVAALFALPAAGVRGATMGIAALLAGFAVEAALVVVAALWVRRKLRRQHRRRRRRSGDGGDDDEPEDGGDVAAAAADGDVQRESIEMDDLRPLISDDRDDDTTQS